ncbi:DNA polymerase I domain containing protein [Acanthamoeba castellanii str. Neff]|uniref:DNA-directed DNA polymerase n=1 Tax=Acanthamoeba castellanii (strain ATCC 30010 / Neff) TaxID=1257118 RepID=L8HHX4_ACACF|nr:DNA polymerase I domain containing protein [Acanthamoeba castellanii str. Neff]ELR25164.1 DNA polymerase I domain containing protein [Acanthamoeba castellanii str. Neff]
MDKEEEKSASTRPSPARNTSVNQQDDEQIDEPAHESQGGSKRAKVALGWQNTRPSAAAKQSPAKSRASSLFLELLQESQTEHEQEEAQAPQLDTSSAADTKKARRPRSLDEYLHTEEQSQLTADLRRGLQKAKMEQSAKKQKTDEAAAGPKKKRQSLIFELLTNGRRDRPGGEGGGGGEADATASMEQRQPKRKVDELRATVGNATLQSDNQKKRTKTSDGSGDELEEEEEEEEEGEREEGHRADDEETKKERRKKEIARVLEAEREEEEELPSLGFSDEEEEALTASSRASTPSARPTSRLDVPARSARGSMSPPPSPIARSASPATTSSSSPSSPSLQQFFHHVNKVKKRMRDEDEIDTGVKTPTTAATGDEEAGRAEPSDAVSGGHGLEGGEEGQQARLASTPDTSPTKTQALKLESPTKNTPSPRRGATPGRNAPGTTPLPSRIIRSEDISMFVKKTGGSIPQGFVNASQDRTTFDAFVQELEASELVCWGTAYRYDTTNFRRSEILDKKVSEDAPIQYKQVLGVGFLPAKAKRPYFVPLNIHDITTYSAAAAAAEEAAEADSETKEVTLADRCEVLKRFVESESIRGKVCYDTQESLKPILALYPRYAVATRNLVDPRLAAYVFDPEMKSYDFPFLATSFSVDQSPKKPSTSPKDSANIKRFFPDMLTCFRLMTNLEARLEKEDLYRVFRDQEMPLATIIAKHQQAIQHRLRSIEEHARRLVGHSVCLSSPKEVAHVLFEELKLPTPRRSRKQLTEQHSTSEKVLLALKEHHPLPALILEYRHCQKLITTYILSFSKKAITGTHRIYASWQHTGTATGRLSVTEPPLSEVHSVEATGEQPQPDDPSLQERIVINVRDAFVAPPGYVLLKADYSQMEMRILAHVSSDEFLMQFFHEGRDIHKLIAARWLGKDPDAVDEVERDRAKRIVYGILYGMGARTLSEILNVDHTEAEQWISTFLEKFPKTAQFLKDTAESAHENGFIRTLLNRRRLFPTINFEAYAHKAERQAVNSVIQGTAADLVKLAMLSIDRALVAEEQRELVDAAVARGSTKGKEKADDVEQQLGESSRPIAALALQVHDELVYEVREDRVQWMEDLMVRCMESGLPIRLDVPLPVRLYLGTRYGHNNDFSAEHN